MSMLQRNIDKTDTSLNQEISFKEIVLGITAWIKYILSKWKIILLVAIAFGVYNFIQANRKHLLYVAASTFVLQEGGGAQPAGPSGIASFLGLDNGGGGESIFQGDNLLELYRSRFMIKNALLSKVPDSTDHFVDRYIKINGLREYWKKENPSLNKINFFKKGNKKYTRIQDSLMTSFIDNIRANYLGVDHMGRLSLFRVEVRSIDEDFSKMFNEQIVKTVNDFYIQTKTLRSTENIRLIQHQADSINRALNGAMYRVASSTDVTINANPARQVLRLPSQRSQVEAENNRAMLNELVRNLELSKMALRKETPLIQILDGPVYPLEKRRESRAKAIITGCVVGGLLTAAAYSLLLLYRKILK
ncbi:lipopolysaccharide biosynthesis protein [Mucilaginibacter sp. HD30]